MSHKRPKNPSEFGMIPSSELVDDLCHAIGQTNWGLYTHVKRMVGEYREPLPIGKRWLRWIAKVSDSTIRRFNGLMDDLGVFEVVPGRGSRATAYRARPESDWNVEKIRGMAADYRDQKRHLWTSQRSPHVDLPGESTESNSGPPRGVHKRPFREEDNKSKKPAARSDAPQSRSAHGRRSGQGPHKQDVEIPGQGNGVPPEIQEYVDRVSTELGPAYSSEYLDLVSLMLSGGSERDRRAVIAGNPHLRQRLEDVEEMLNAHKP